MAAPALAQNAFVTRIPNWRSFGDTVVTTAANYSTTTPTVEASVVGNTVYDPGILQSQNSSLYVYEHLRVMWSADVSKATSTTGSCAIYLNGAVVAGSVRSAGYAGGEGVLAGYADLSYPANNFNVGSPTQVQTVTLQCYSADTATFTVNRAQLHVDEVF
jgi:hypothetical protein